MAPVKPRTLKGFRDYLPSDDVRRQAALRTVARVFESHGFGPLTTPVLEYAEVLLGKYGSEGDQLLYRFEDNGGRDVAMRYDLTVPLARVVAQHGSLPRPFKRYQIAPVWRAEKPARGRYREFTQCDFDIIGTDSLSADFEILLVMARGLQSLDIGDFRIHLSHRGIFNRLLEKSMLLVDQVYGVIAPAHTRLIGYDYGQKPVFIQ